MLNPIESTDHNQTTPYVRSLKELIDLVCGRNLKEENAAGDSGIAEKMPFPFLALVGQQEMKLALIMALINPALGGVLLIGPRGTGKTTAVRSLLELLPEVERSKCFYGCLPEDIKTGGMDAVCPDCAKKFAERIPLTIMDRVKLVELPLNTTLEDVVGGLDERALVNERMRIKRGILAQSDSNLLYLDETNLLTNEIIDAILDAAAQGTFTVRRGAVSATYRARFTLVGSLNPEEGSLRPQIMDRFGFRVIVQGLDNPNQRFEAYKRVRAYLHNPRGLISSYQAETELVCAEIQHARNLLPSVEIPDDIARSGIALVQSLKIDSLRAEITLFEGARAYTAMDGRSRVDLNDLRVVAPMALRLRRSKFILDYLSQQQAEESELLQQLDGIFYKSE
jgi:magnesium chelatase subunit I